MKTTLSLPATAKQRERVFANRPAFYVGLVIAALLVGFAYQFKTQTIFACQADGYSADQYIAYCNGTRYADYEHGAFWFDLEPAANAFAANADMLFLGNSRTQIAFSTAATRDWFMAAGARYYLLGFSYEENVVMAEELLRKLHPRAKVYVINVDNFFDRYETFPMKALLHDPDARGRYQAKRLWQHIHEPICKAVPTVCGNDYVIFRSRETGAYTKRTYKQNSLPVSYDEALERDVIERNTATALAFLPRVKVDRDCIILTMVPTVGTKIGNVRAVAKSLGASFITPEGVDGLRTFDGSHLDKPSAELWSRAFLEAASSKIHSCLARQFPE
jgi:hypothetical protein